MEWNEQRSSQTKEKNTKRCLTLLVIKVTNLSPLLPGTVPVLALKVQYSGILLYPGQGILASDYNYFVFLSLPFFLVSE